MVQTLERVSDTIWEIPISYKEGMRVPARIYGTEKLIEQMDETVYEQLTNVAVVSENSRFPFAERTPSQLPAGQGRATGQRHGFPCILGP